jgi:hypothetical protein
MARRPARLYRTWPWIALILAGLLTTAEGAGFVTLGWLTVGAGVALAAHAVRHNRAARRAARLAALGAAAGAASGAEPAAACPTASQRPRRPRIPAPGDGPTARPGVHPPPALNETRTRAGSPRQSRRPARQS